MAVSLSLPTARPKQPAAATPANDAQKGTVHLRNGRLLRYLVRLGYMAAAALALVLLGLWASPAAETLSVDADSAVQAFVAAPYVSSDPSLPSAAAVFQGHAGEAAPQVDGF